MLDRKGRHINRESAAPMTLSRDEWLVVNRALQDRVEVLRETVDDLLRKVGSRVQASGVAYARACGQDLEGTDVTDDDSLRLEAAEQFGFRGGDNRYACTEAQLIAFAKACERAGMARTVAYIRMHERALEYYEWGRALNWTAKQLDVQIAAIDAELAPLLEAERVRK